MSEGKKRILVIEDDRHIAEGLELNLSLQDYSVAVAFDGGTGINKWREWCPDLIVLDIMLPDMDGLSVLQHIRLKDEKLPILILSAKGDPDDRIKGLSYGVDDYVSKPFNLDEFLLRVERMLMRVDWYRGEGISNGGQVPANFEFGENRIDFTRNLARCRAGKIHLTEQESQLLKLFIANQGHPLTRSTLLEIGWGYTRDMTTRTVDNFVVRLRKYFEPDPRNPRYFKSVRSVGYVFEVEPETGKT